MLPWYADKIYRGVRIDGRWVEDTSKIATFVLAQKGDRITGTYFHNIQVSGGAKREEYRVTGTLRDTYVTLSSQPIARDVIDTGAYVFRLCHAEEAKLFMKGKVVYIDTDTAEVKAADMKFLKETS